MAFKILNDIYPSNHFLHERFHWNNFIRGFCERDIETVGHIYFQCESVQEFRVSFQSWLQSKDILLHPLNVVSVNNGILMEEKNLDSLENNLIITFFSTDQICA